MASKAIGVFSRMNKSHMASILVKIGFINEARGRVLADSSDVKNIATTLAKELAKRYKTTDMADCERCGAQGPVTNGWSACAFCGAGDEEIQKAEGTKMKKISKGAEKSKPAEEEEVELEEEETDEADAEEEEGDEEPVKQKLVKKERNKAPKADALAKVEKKEIEPLPAGVTVEILDQYVADVNTKKGDAAASMWDLGLVIRELHSGQYWKARRAEDGTPIYKSFEKFCGLELGMTAANAYQMIDIAVAFTKEQVKQLGTTKLGLILKAPEEAQPKLLAAAQTHSKRELALQVDEAKKKAGKSDEKRDTGRKAMPKGKDGASGGGKAVKSGKDSLVIASIVDQSIVVPLFQKPIKKGAGLEVRATSIEDGPCGYFELANKVRVLVVLNLSSKGELTLKLHPKRIED